MSHVLMIVPVGADVDLETATSVLHDSFENKKISVGLFEPVVSTYEKSEATEAVNLSEVEHFLGQGGFDWLLEDIFANYVRAANGKDIVLVKGLVYTIGKPYAWRLNREIAIALDAGIILVARAGNGGSSKLEEQIEIALNYYGKNVLGCFIHESTEPVKFTNPNIKLLGSIANEDKGVINLDKNSITSFFVSRKEAHLSPPAFRYQLVQKARQANKRIILPEGNEPRTIRAAMICAERNIARCVLIGWKDEIYKVAKQNDIAIDDRIEIIEPKEAVIEKYVEPMVEIRKHKGLTAEMARVGLKDHVVLGTMMLQLGEVDGLVSGAMHTTANTIRPAFQLIKYKKDVKLVSSIFFMCLPEQVFVFGDCAVNTNPNAEELADIAIQSADSASAFGITPRVAMISYSTGASGFGPDIDRVREATKIVREKRPELLVDGPLQYDAAIDSKVAKLKIPDSKVAGKATVMIFPDLNVGNAISKAVQRSAGIICIGPMLQGLRKPVNDLSRGCSVEDIVFTIALTAVQASQEL
jgi:phosphate acetyltransferase